MEIFPGLVVRLEPSEFTCSRFNFIPDIDPRRGGIYRVEKLDKEGLVYLEDGAGPFLQEDLVPAVSTEFHQVRRIPREIEKKAILTGVGVDMPKLEPGDRVVCTATWSLPQFATQQGWPVQGVPYEVESVETDGLYFRLKGFTDKFPTWHFQKHAGGELKT